ncbi:hypothetical protein PAT3040_06294 [Paenibacillus agaridevorans]|uniref:Uncharacterized protein n=1 Tax=Paenibacillus agaridevorans TaxID=171404 RepID=A0A2R5F4D5_9BACL|nr:hypothetical protein PAT3040_06294 [Paenibacillus agaridevorans]
MLLDNKLDTIVNKRYVPVVYGRVRLVGDCCKSKNSGAGIVSLAPLFLSFLMIFDQGMLHVKKMNLPSRATSSSPAFE